MSRLAAELQPTSLPAIGSEALIALSEYDWPGNVRELRNVLKLSLMLSDGRNLHIALPSIDAIHPSRRHMSHFPEHELTLHDVTDEMIKSLCLEAFRRCKGNKRCAARVLGMALDSLYRHMKRFGIEGENPPKD